VDEMDFPLDIDLGELIPRHHVVLTGIDFGETVDVPRFRAEVEAELAERVARISRGEVEVPGGLGISVSYRELTPHDLEPVGTRKMEPSLHYEFVPGIEPSEEETNGGMFWCWMLSVSDDVGTHYRDDNGGAKGPATGGMATPATRDIGGHIPSFSARDPRLQPQSHPDPSFHPNLISQRGSLLAEAPKLHDCLGSSTRSVRPAETSLIGAGIPGGLKGSMHHFG